MVKPGPEVGSAEWLRLVTASKVAPILGLSPDAWGSPYAMWHLMTGRVSQDTRNAAGKARGHYLEDGIIRWWLDQHPGADGRQQAWAPFEHWAGATSDLAGVDEHGRKFVLNAKTDGSYDWPDGVPPYYLVAGQWEMLCAGAEVCYFPVLHGNLRFKEYEPMVRDDVLIEDIVYVCRQFWESLEFDEPPELDDSVSTYDVAKRLHPDIDRDLVVTVPQDLATRYVAADTTEQVAAREARAARTALLTHMGRAVRAIDEAGEVLARRQPNKYGISLVPVLSRKGEQIDE